ncbi:MAG: deoxyribose-phosphate aldolase [Bacteroidetes bacterium]|uniref:Deoxyribose-phosphate aldolase n=1 Tax=Candidatus Gallipaludibacter merdavium TaxID=2840839 RepID=A0A9D9N507_9BACT|nr:deoxyribose-phosphate aldolase [Candidatus Gallipaludibacter merdavium]
MNKFEELFAQYDCALKDEAVKAATAKIVDEHFAENDNVDVYKQCFNQIDLTTLNGDDTVGKVATMTKRVNEFPTVFPDVPNVAAICVYPAMVPVVKENLTAPVGIASVSAGFPASQTFIEIKVAETAMAVMEGATEIDVVISIGKFLEGDYQTVYDELCELRAASREAHLKVILETGLLGSAENIKKASILAMSAGADFIKTSTGKTTVSATPEATYVMCGAIKEWYQKTGAVVGYKPAGGVSTTQEAVVHYTLVKEILGKEWLNNQRFRFGASRLANKLLSSIEGKDIVYF